MEGNLMGTAVKGLFNNDVSIVSVVFTYTVKIIVESRDMCK